jgi:hypothetical protein
LEETLLSIERIALQGGRNTGTLNGGSNGFTASGVIAQYYPPVLHINLAENGMLVIWTSQRNVENKQVVDIYDQDFKLVGTDLKYAHPTISNYMFMNGNVYAPD